MGGLLMASTDRVDSVKLLTVQAVAALLGCSTRQVFRLSKAGKMPPPLKIGHLVRWNQAEIARWIAAGCPPWPLPNEESAGHDHPEAPPGNPLGNHDLALAELPPGIPWLTLNHAREPGFGSER